MKKNEILNLTCADLTRAGYGCCFYEGKPVFVSTLLPGEKAEVKIIKDNKKYAIGIIHKLLEKSPYRLSPKCAIANKCGGCQLQHIEYERGLYYKREQLQHLFDSVGTDIEVLPVLGMDDPWFYRNKAQFPVQVHDGKVKIGFYREHSNDIVENRTCAIQSSEINAIYMWLQDHLNPENAQGLRHIFIRASKETKEVQVVFIGSEEKEIKNLVPDLVRAFPEIQSVLFNQNDRKDNVILGDKYSILYGRDFIYEMSLNNKVALHFKSFFQVNPIMMEVLYSKAIEMADIHAGDTVIDLYSGTGTISMTLARKAKKVIGVEIVQEAVENAKENAKLNQIENIDFICEDASKFALEFRKSKQKADVVMVDPPRKGLTPQGIEDICTIKPEKIVYISCNADTLARDLKIFKEKNYITNVVQPVDMFCQTVHCECIALLMPVKKNLN